VTVAPVEAGAPALELRVNGVEAVAHAVVPTLAFRLHVDAGGRDVRSLALNVQIRIDAPRRRYAPEERERLFELFGLPRDWGRTLRSLRWTTVSLTVPPFVGETTVELPVPCTYDFDVVATKYLHALDGGEVPLEMLFSGTVFYAGPGGALRIAHVPWDREAEFRMPVRLWKDVMDRYFPGTAWLRVGTTAFDRLNAYRVRMALPTWDAALEALLAEAEAG
jgi:hypothetical protein